MRRVTLVRGAPEAIQERVRRRYETEIERLSTVGFHEYSFSCGEGQVPDE